MGQSDLSSLAMGLALRRAVSVIGMLVSANSGIPNTNIHTNNWTDCHRMTAHTHQSNKVGFIEVFMIIRTVADASE
jgi:hypothetical protein